MFLQITDLSNYTLDARESTEYRKHWPTMEILLK